LRRVMKNGLSLVDLFLLACVLLVGACLGYGALLRPVARVLLVLLTPPEG
jgi:hypothetical protein